MRFNFTIYRNHKRKVIQTALRKRACLLFLSRAQKELRPLGVFISADVFGLTTATDDEQHIGQRLRDRVTLRGAVWLETAAGTVDLGLVRRPSALVRVIDRQRHECADVFDGDHLHGLFRPQAEAAEDAELGEEAR